ncbi:MAG TPA: flagellar basal body rod protein FlgB [Syntrophorhabdaceae bacterium]|nr:flagellar basal body rod protein FlgB [Syntrophorhabdaceae bacterium]
MDVINLIGKALNIRASAHKVISGNIANVETPGYKEKNVDFKKEMDRVMHLDSASSIGNVEVTENTLNDGLASIDGNTVNVENEIVKLTENQLMYHSLVQIAAKRFSMMKFLISEGKR